MRNAFRRLLAPMLFTGLAGPVLAQGIPTTQPNRLLIYIEAVKLGMGAEHERHEAGWPAAYAKANSPYYYLAFSSMTGPAESWYVSSYDSYASEAQQMKSESADPELSAELARLSRVDAQYLDSGMAVEAIARPDLSYGAFPDLGLARFFNIATIRIRLGHEQSFEAAAKVYMENVKRLNPGASYRVYQVINGMPGANYLIFSSVNDYADLDKVMAAEMSMMQSVSPKDMAILQKTSSDDFQNVISNRFRLSPGMSYVSAETKAKDPAFWNKR